MTEQINARLVEALKLVPVEPTQEMISHTATVEHCGAAEPHTANIYRAMIAAAPEAPAPAVEKPECALPTVDEAISLLAGALLESKGWMRGYSDAVIRDAIDRKAEREPLTERQIDEVFRKYGTGRPDGFAAAVRELVESYPQHEQLSEAKYAPGTVKVDGYGYVDLKAVRAVERAHGIGATK